MTSGSHTTFLPYFSLVTMNRFPKNLTGAWERPGAGRAVLQADGQRDSMGSWKFMALGAGVSGPPFRQMLSCAKERNKS